jgi:hypothetical protein
MRIDHELLRKVAREHTERLCCEFFPNGKKVKDEWQTGNLGGDNGRSLRIHLSGEKAGLFYDFNTGDKGNFVTAVMQSRGLDFVAAALEIGKVVSIDVSLSGRLKEPDKRASGLDTPPAALLSRLTGIAIINLLSPISANLQPGADTQTNSVVGRTPII